MITSKHIKTFLFVFLIVNFCLIPSIFSQSIDVMKQNLISNISLISMEGSPILQIEGEFKSLDRSDIIVQESEGEAFFTIEIKKAIIDPTKIQSNSLQFDFDDPISSVEIEERPPISGGMDDSFSVILSVMAKKDYKIEIEPPIAGAPLLAVLKEKPEIVPEPQEAQKPQEAKEEPKMEEAISKQKEIEQREQEAQQKGLKTVEEVIAQYRKPSIMQVAIYNASGYPKRAYALSVYLGKLKKEYIEESLGMKLEIVNISNAKNMNQKMSSIYFRDNYLKSALFLARLIKGDQRIVPIQAEDEKEGVDLEIFLGRDYK